MIEKSQEPEEEKLMFALSWKEYKKQKAEVPSDVLQVHSQRLWERQKVVRRQIRLRMGQKAQKLAFCMVSDLLFTS